MTKARILILACFLLTLAAGAAAGLLAGRLTKAPRRGHGIASKLELSPEQRESFKEIWSETQEKVRTHMRARREQLATERDQAIRALLSEEALARYEAQSEEHREKMAALRDELKGMVDKAVERTKALLTAEQRKQYEELLKKREESGHRFRFGGPPPAQTQKAAPPGGQD